MEERIEMLKEQFKDHQSVKVDQWSGLIVDYAKEKEIGTIIRVLRPTGDFEIEFQMASMNNKLNSNIETVFFMTEGPNYYISSTLVREVFHHGGEISEFVPEKINEYMRKAKSEK